MEMRLYDGKIPGDAGLEPAATKTPVPSSYFAILYMI
jgi:hypothetical protein